MRRQVRPFIVEVKQKRGHAKRHRSIWGDLDLSAIAGTKEDPEPLKSEEPERVDSNALPVNAEEGPNARSENNMADLKETEPGQASNEAPVTENGAETKRKASRSKTAKPQPRRSARKASAPAQAEAATAQPPAAVRSARKPYSEKERAQKLSQIEKSIGRGESLKNSVREVGISEQTYYHWKKAAQAPASSSGDLKDLIALEEENKRLKNLLAVRLRKENAELKKKLGLD